MDTPARTSPDRRAVRDRDAAVARSERVRRALVTGSVASSVGIAGALAISAIAGQPSAASTPSGNGSSTPQRAAHPHLTQTQRILRRLESQSGGSTNGSSGGSSGGQSGGPSQNNGSQGGGLSSGTGPSHATTSGS